MSKEIHEYKITVSTTDGEREIRFDKEDYSYEEVVKTTKSLHKKFNNGEGDEIRSFFGITDDNVYIRSRPKLHFVKTQELEIHE